MRADSSAKRGNEFVMEENLKWLWYAFSAAWILHVLYLGSLSVREKKLRQQLQNLKALVEEGDGEKA